MLKTPLISDGADADNIYRANLQKQHSLFAGTAVIQARSYSNSPVTAIVTRTGMEIHNLTPSVIDSLIPLDDILCFFITIGFYSLKGSLVRSILYPKPMNMKLYRDAIGFVACLAFLGK